MSNFFNFKNRSEDWCKFRDKLQLKTIESLPDSYFKIEFRSYILGTQYLGTGNFIIFWLFANNFRNRILNPILDLFFAKKVYNTAKINSNNHTKKVKIRTLKKGYYTYAESISKADILKNTNLLKKLNSCDHIITDLNTKEKRYNFCKNKLIKAINKKSLHLLFTQKHFYFDECANAIRADAIKNGFKKIFTISHGRLLYFREGKDKKNNGFLTCDNFGVTIKTNAIGGICEEHNIPFGLFNNKSYFDGNCFAIDLGVEVTQKFINEFLCFSTLPTGQANIPEVEHGLEKIHNVSDAMSSCFRPISLNMSFIKRKLAHLYNKYYIPFIVYLASRRDNPGTQFCFKSIGQEVLSNIYKMLDNKEYIKSHKYTAEDREKLKYALDNELYWTMDLLMVIANMSFHTGIFTDDVIVITDK